MREGPGGLARLEVHDRVRDIEILAQVKAQKAERGGQDEVGPLDARLNLGEHACQQRPQNPLETADETDWVASRGQQSLSFGRRDDLSGIMGEGVEIQARLGDQLLVAGTGDHPHGMPLAGQPPAQRQTRLDVPAGPRGNDHYGSIHLHLDLCGAPLPPHGMSDPVTALLASRRATWRLVTAPRALAAGAARLARRRARAPVLCEVCGGSRDRAQPTQHAAA